MVALLIVLALFAVAAFFAIGLRVVINCIIARAVMQSVGGRWVIRRRA